MSNDDGIPTGSNEELEEWFLNAISEDPLPVDSMLNVLSQLWEDDEDEIAEGSADLLQDALTERNMVNELIELLRVRALANDSADFKKAARETLENLLADDRTKRMFVACSAFDSKEPASDCIARLQTLLSLAPGLACRDKTWGFGIVKRIDAFYKKVEIDFDKKRNHEMSFEYAGQAIELIGEDHLLVMHHKDPKALQAMVKKNPAEVCRITMRSFGPMTSIILQEILVPLVVAESYWKDFWMRSRKVLKADPLIDMPPKRTDVIYMREEARAYDSNWFKKLSGIREANKLTACFEELADNSKGLEIDDESLAVLHTKIKFMIDAGTQQYLDLITRILLACFRIGIEVPEEAITSWVDTLLSVKSIIRLEKGLHAKHMRPMLDYLLKNERERMLELLADHIRELPTTLQNDAMAIFEAEKELPRIELAYQKAFTARNASLQMLGWIARRLELIKSWGLGCELAFVQQILSILEHPSRGTEQKARKYLKDLFTNRDWLVEVMADMRESEKRDMLIRIRDNGGLDGAIINSATARILVIEPALQKVLAEEASSEQDSRPTGGLTSWRGLAVRQQRLHHLVTVDMPANAKDLGIARSYGDLKENHAYKAAKEKQTILNKQRDDMEQELQVVRGTDFIGFPTDRVGLGTKVVVRSITGDDREVLIMGEWDTDLDRNIIACAAPLAQLLMGRRIGDELEIPGEHGKELIHIAEITALPDDVLAWANERNP